MIAFSLGRVPSRRSSSEDNRCKVLDERICQRNSNTLTSLEGTFATRVVGHYTFDAMLETAVSNVLR